MFQAENAGFMQKTDLDGFDRRLLLALQQDGRLSNVELSERVHLSASQCQRRVKRMEEAGVIESYAALLNREKIGLGVMAFVNITLERHGVASAQAFREAIGHCSKILECWSVSGEADYLLRVVAADLKTFSDFLLYELQAMPFVATVRSNILLEQMKATTVLPLPSHPDQE